MARKFTLPKLVIASHNAGKVREIGELLAPFGTEVVSAGDLGLPEPIEDGDTFVANAQLKALSAVTHSGLPALADDSGLAVEALGGKPGIHSARWAGPNKDFNMAMQEIEKQLTGHTNRAAHFVCALTLAWPEDDQGTVHMETFEGKVHGELTWPMRGEKGFGYDPIFIADGYTKTFAQIDPAEKHAISHRADAFRQLVEACFS